MASLCNNNVAAGQPLKLVTVNTAPERAFRLIGRVVESLKEQYTIIHAANVERIEDVRSTVTRVQPDLLCCASMWTPEQSREIQAIAHEVKSSIRTMAIPQGLQVQEGPDAIVKYLIQKMPALIMSDAIQSTQNGESVVGSFRQYLPDLNSSRFQIAKMQNAYEYSEAFQKNRNPPWLYKLTQAWEELLEEPYRGITTDGDLVPNLFAVQDEGVPIKNIVSAVDKVLQKLTPAEQSKVSYPLNAKEWRAWSNPELLLRPFGLRLEETSDEVNSLILSVLQVTFSPEGYQKAIAAMRINHFLGQVCEVPAVMNKDSYNFLLFGQISTDKPWGWSLYGHHLCINVFLHGSQIVISPTFTGAEPNMIDEGEWSGTQILNVEGETGLKLMQSLSEEQKLKAQIYKLLHDPGMLQTGDLTKDRWNKDDQRHVCGAFRDNRIVPYEGLPISGFTPAQQQWILDITEQFILYLPETARKLRLKQVEQHFDNTFFCWIGGWGDDDPFYYRIQSPVIIMEFDHHSGVFLSNSDPAKFHTHTILRTPNAGDYGCALRLPKDVVR